MIMEELIKRGFKLSSYNSGSHKTTCPRCSNSRKNKNDPCVSVTITDSTALYNCHHCGWSGSIGNATNIPTQKEYKKPELPKGQVGNMPEKGANFLKERKITRAVWERNKLFFDAEKQALCLPFIFNGETINIKYRKIEEKKFALSKGAQLIFYGLDDIKGKEEIIIVEGEMDKLALNVCGFDNVISVPNGAPSKAKQGKVENIGAFEYLHHAEEIIKNIKKVILAVDNDAAGQTLRYELARRIGLEKCYIVEFPEKDANDCLVNNDIDTVCEYINAARPYPINGLYSVSDFESSLISFFRKEMQKGVSTGWQTLDIFYSVPTKRISVVTGIPNSGKSEFLDCLLWNIVKQNNWIFAIFSPENSKEMHVTKLIEKIMEKPTDPKSPLRMSEDQFIEGSRIVLKHFHFIVAEDCNSLPNLDWILDKARIAIYRYGIKGIVIDPYNEIDRPTNESETDYISKMLSKLKKFAVTYDIHIWIVAHPTKLYKEKDGTYAVPSLYDIAGSANWVNKTDFGIVVHRANNTMNISEIHLKKVRFKHEGNNGSCNLLYDKDTGTYSEPNKQKNYSEFEADEISFDA